MELVELHHWYFLCVRCYYWGPYWKIC